MKVHKYAGLKRNTVGKFWIACVPCGTYVPMDGQHCGRFEYDPQKVTCKKCLKIMEKKP
jgi:predicted nucleic acid-binding Zn ribbon protein